MDVTDAFEIQITESSQIGEARRNIVKFAHSLGFSEANEARLGLVCAELSTNLLKHTGSGGQLIVQGLHKAEEAGIEIYSVDSGRGMHVADCLEDGFSTKGTMGTGLGAVKRNADVFQIYSQVGKGSVVHARIWNFASKSFPASNYAGFTVPKTGEEMSGDKWSVVESEQAVYCLLVDGLGHGLEASEASQLAVRRFKENLGQPPSVILKAIHSSLRGTRGAVGAIAQIDRRASKVHFCGLGNISSVVATQTERKHLTSLNGTLGYEGRRFTEFSIPWNKDSILFMHSDGLSSKTLQDTYELHSQPAAIVAGWLYKHYSRGTDDSTILVYKEQ